jgi:hypothetical protein
LLIEKWIGMYSSWSRESHQFLINNVRTTVREVEGQCSTGSYSENFHADHQTMLTILYILCKLGGVFLLISDLLNTNCYLKWRYTKLGYRGLFLPSMCKAFYKFIWPPVYTNIPVPSKSRCCRWSSRDISAHFQGHIHPLKFQNHEADFFTYLTNMGTYGKIPHTWKTTVIYVQWNNSHSRQVTGRTCITGNSIQYPVTKVQCPTRNIPQTAP